MAPSPRTGSTKTTQAANGLKRLACRRPSTRSKRSAKPSAPECSFSIRSRLRTMPCIASRRPHPRPRKRPPSARKFSRRQERGEPSGSPLFLRTTISVIPTRGYAPHGHSRYSLDSSLWSPAATCVQNDISVGRGCKVQQECHSERSAAERRIQRMLMRRKRNYPHASRILQLISEAGVCCGERMVAFPHLPAYNASRYGARRFRIKLPSLACKM